MSRCVNGVDARSLATTGYRRSVVLPTSVEQALTWHRRAGALPRLLPPWQRVEILRESEPLPGQETVLQLRSWWRRHEWVAHFHGLLDGIGFADEQARGPFAVWRHEHRFTDAPGGACQLEDRIRYRLPLAPVSRVLADWWVRRQLDHLFAFRHQRTINDLRQHARFHGQPHQTIVVTGSSGLIGQQLVAYLQGAGHRVRRLLRRRGDAGQATFGWDPEGGQLDVEALRGCDAVVHLAGANIAGGRWTPARRRQIRESRVRGTALLVQEMRRHAPQARLVVATAIGYYGETGEAVAHERSPLGSGFLAGVCDDWEAALHAASEAGLAVRILRLGVVLSARGGALARMLPAFRAGLGGRIGGGQQWLSWIALDDVLGLIEHALFTPSCPRVVNAVAPQAVRQAELARCLGRVLRRPALLPLPAFVVQLLFGRMGQALLLASQRVENRSLDAYPWLFPDLESCLRFELGP